MLNEIKLIRFSGQNSSDELLIPALFCYMKSQLNFDNFKFEIYSTTLVRHPSIILRERCLTSVTEHSDDIRFMGNKVP